VEIEDIYRIVMSWRFRSINNEKLLQGEISKVFVSHGDFFSSEYRLDDKNIIDFFFHKNGIGVEVKIKSNISKQAIYRQCERYCSFDKVKKLVLLTNRSIRLPSKINDKDCYVFSLGASCL